MDPILREFLQMVVNGDFDEDVDGLKTVQGAITTRVHEIVFGEDHERKEPEQKLFRVGGIVHFNNRVSPKYLRGIEAIVTKVNDKTCVVSIEQNPKAQRFSGSHNVRAQKSTLSID